MNTINLKISIPNTLTKTHSFIQQSIPITITPEGIAQGFLKSKSKLDNQHSMFVIRRISSKKD